MSAKDILTQNNGLKTTGTVLSKQQSGEDAAQKANPEAAKEQAAQRNQQTAAAMMQGEIPIVKKKEEAPTGESQQEAPRQKSYAEMFKELYGNGEETEEMRKKRERRERTRAVIAAVGDGIRALSDMYYSSKGARVYRDPNSDLTATMMKRKQMLEAERKKNHDAWLTGYQKAMALDESARKNDRTLAETVRHHKELEEAVKVKNNQTDRKLDQNDVKLDQGQQRLDLTKWKYTNDADYKNSLLKIKEMLANGQISHWGAQDAMAQMRESRLASKANASSGGNGTTAGYWYEYYDLMDSDEGKKQIESAKRKYGIRNVTQTNVRYLMDKIKGRRSQGAPSNTGGGNGTQKGGKGSSASKGGKKSTGVKW